MYGRRLNPRHADDRVSDFAVRLPSGHHGISSRALPRTATSSDRGRRGGDGGDTRWLRGRHGLHLGVDEPSGSTGRAGGEASVDVRLPCDVQPGRHPWVGQHGVVAVNGCGATRSSTCHFTGHVWHPNRDAAGSLALQRRGRHQAAGLCRATGHRTRNWGPQPSRHVGRRRGTRLGRAFHGRRAWRRPGVGGFRVHCLCHQHDDRPVARRPTADDIWRSRCADRERAPRDSRISRQPVFAFGRCSSRRIPPSRCWRFQHRANPLHVDGEDPAHASEPCCRICADHWLCGHHCRASGHRPHRTCHEPPNSIFFSSAPRCWSSRYPRSIFHRV